MIKSMLKALFKAFLFFIFLWIFLALPWSIKLCVIIFVIIWTRRASWVKQDKISMYFGVPGSGKTTFAAWYVRQAQKKGIPVYSNVPVHGAYKIERSDIGQYMLKDCLIIIDEASLEYNNRDFKNFLKNENYFYSMHRHYCAEVIFFSQGWEDADKRIRTLTQRLFLVKKSLIPYMIARKEIRKCIDIDKETHQVIDGYSFRNWFVGTKYIFSPVLWKYFDSFECKELPGKEFELWYPEDLPLLSEDVSPESDSSVVPAVDSSFSFWVPDEIDSSELKPCFFCGDQGRLGYFKEVDNPSFDPEECYAVRCYSCNCHTSYRSYNTRLDAIVDWNSGKARLGDGF